MANASLIKEVNGKKFFHRFTIGQRIQHAILFSTVLTLVATGMPLKFSTEAWAKTWYKFLGGPTVVPVIHKTAGLTILGLFVFHVFYLIRVIYLDRIRPLVLRDELTLSSFVNTMINLPLLPHIRDVKGVIDTLRYLLFFTNEHPRMAEFSWKEKFDYWAPFWGMIIIGASGLMMWFKEKATIILPGWAINYGLIAHSDEALLAAIFLIVWHWYNVHYSINVFPGRTTFITGYMPEELMVEEHYDYYVEVMKKEGRESEIRPPHGAHH